MAEKTIAKHKGREITGEVDLQDLLDALEALRAAVEALPAQIAAALSAPE